MHIHFDEAKLNRFLITIPRHCHPSLSSNRDSTSYQHDDACYYLGAHSNPDAIASLRQDDVRAPIHSSLAKSPLWWLLEFFPIIERKQAADGKWNLRPQCVPIALICLIATLSSLTTFSALPASTYSLREMFLAPNRAILPTRKRRKMKSIKQRESPRPQAH